ncbi:MAG: homoserine O-acetyltransferase [Planctomycetaceae bacterium]|nr:homoserine O-acetyltransferase [Planctomycetaceae bacterium]
MPNDQFDSSDSLRSASPLNHLQTVTFREPLRLELGRELSEVTVAFETYGRLNAAGDNAVLICHALSGDSHVAKHDEADDPGWWDIMVGPGKAIDTDRYFVICPNFLGGCRGSTGPNSIDPATGQPYATDFPVVTLGDIVETQRRLIDHLGIHRLRAVVGGSLGGHAALTWATRLPERLVGTVAIATSPRLTSQALAFDVVGRNAILRDPTYHKGRYYDLEHGPTVGLAIARMLGHITYLSREAMMQKFDAQRLRPRDVHTQFETKFAVGSYLAYQGDRFGERFDANSYLTLTMAIDLFDLGATRESLREALDRSTCRWLLMSFSSDWLFPPFQSQELVDALIAADKPVSYCCVQTDCGHDAFLLPNQLPIYGEMIRAFLENLGDGTDGAGAGRTSAVDCTMAPLPQPPSSSIFHHHRLDYENILNLIPPGASVLDLGCGTGGLLARLRARGHKHLVGVEWDEQAILTCVRRGLNVVQADLNKGLPAFTDGQFDFVVLSQTLQIVLDVSKLLHDMLRVGRRGIVSFPNIAFRKRRDELAKLGRSPQVQADQGFQWHNTPYLRWLSIADFEDFCRQQGVTIHQQIDLDTEADVVIHDNPNLNADVAVMVLSR